ncbi:MAG: cation:H+ antiporter [Candidatus Azotimanducaceae bacterium]|jgi:cation:H+ antiporter
MWLEILVLVGGFIGLVASADAFQLGVASTAHKFGVSKLVLGLTVVAVGTSAPEIFVAIAASLDGNQLLAVGNAIGSNISNIGLVLGIAAMIAPLPFTKTVLHQELPCLVVVTFVSLVLISNLYLSLVDGTILLFGLCLMLYLLYRKQKGNRAVSDAMDEELDELDGLSMQQGMVRLFTGLIVLLISAEVLVWAATSLAIQMGVSDLIIGLTIVAVGTSLPELGVTVAAVRKGNSEIAIGNIIGSNILNLLAVLAVPALIGGVEIPMIALARDGVVMMALTIAMALFAYGLNSRSVMTRFEGVTLVGAWLGYMVMVIH